MWSIAGGQRLDHTKLTRYLVGLPLVVGWTTNEFYFLCKLNKLDSAFSCARALLTLAKEYLVPGLLRARLGIGPGLTVLVGRFNINLGATKIVK